MDKIREEVRLELRRQPKLSSFMRQTWRDLLFLSWEVDPDEIQKSLPEGLFVDTFQGKAYITLVPMFVEQHRLGLSVPGFTDFLEVNVRTYVYDKEGIPGVWFYSLDFSSRLGCFIANRFFNLPYVFSELEGRREESIYLKGVRHHKTHMEFTYKPEDETFLAEMGSLDFFIAERYTLYTAKGNKLDRGRIYHKPYPLSKVEATFKADDLFQINHLKNPGRKPDHIIFSKGVDVDFYRFTKIAL